MRGRISVPEGLCHLVLVNRGRREVMSDRGRSTIRETADAVHALIGSTYKKGLVASSPWTPAGDAVHPFLERFRRGSMYYVRELFELTWYSNTDPDHYHHNFQRWNVLDEWLERECTSGIDVAILCVSLRVVPAYANHFMKTRYDIPDACEGRKIIEGGAAHIDTKKKQLLFIPE